MLKRISLFVVLLLIFSSCSNEEKAPTRKIEVYVSAVLKDNKEVVFFGKAGLKGIVDKTNYKNEPLIEGLVTAEIEKLNNVIDIDSPVHFIVEGTVSDDGIAERVILFMHIKDADKLEVELQKGYTFLVEKVGNIRYAEDNEFVIAFRNDLAIAIIQHGDYDAKNVVKKLFDKSQGKVCGGKIDEMLSAKSDVVVNVLLENVYGLTSNDRGTINIDQQKSIEKMVKGSYVQTTLNFEKGGMTLESKNYFSKELKNLMFFKSNGSSEMSQAIAKGDGNIIGGLSMNVDVKKLEAYSASFAPEVFAKMDSQFSKMGGLIQYISSGNILSSLSTGEFGALAISQSKNDELGVGIRTFVGAQEAGQKVFMLARSEMELPADVEFNYVKGGIEALFPVDGTSLAMMKGDKRLTMPKGSENFGKLGIFGFVNLKGIHGSFEPLQKSLIDMLDYVTFEGDNDGFKLYLKTKNQKDNILKQGMDIAMDLLPRMMMSGGMPF